MQFTETSSKAIYERIRVLIQEELKGTPVTLGKYRGSWDTYGFNINLTLKTVGEDGTTQEALDFKRHAAFEFQGWLGEAVQSPNGIIYELTGFKTSARKNKYQIRNVETDERRVCDYWTLSRFKLVTS